MAVADVAEHVVVTASTPVLDVRRQGNVTNFDQAMLNGIPTARDPWALMQQLPGVLDRAAQCRRIRKHQPGRSSRPVATTGRTRCGTSTGSRSPTWPRPAPARPTSTSMSSRKRSSRPASLDSRQQTGGLGINLVTKRGDERAARLGPDLLQQRRSAAREHLERAEGRRPLRGIASGSSPNTAADVSGPLCERIGSGSGPGCRESTSVSWPSTVFRTTAFVNTFAARGDAQAVAGDALVVSLSPRREAQGRPGRRAEPPA